MVNSYQDEGSFSPLRVYVIGKTTVNQGEHVCFTNAELAQLFLLNLSFCCLKIKDECQNVSEAAIDALCVSGLIKYPPSEGGPLSYFVCNGKDSCLRRFMDQLFTAFLTLLTLMLTCLYSSVQ